MIVLDMELILANSFSFYTARSAGQKGCVNMPRLRFVRGGRLKEPITVKQENRSSSVIGQRGS